MRKMGKGDIKEYTGKKMSVPYVMRKGIGRKIVLFIFYFLKKDKGKSIFNECVIECGG